MVGEVMFKRLFLSGKKRLMGQFIADSGSGVLQRVFPLSDCLPNTNVTVIANRDRKTLEMGLYVGAVIRIIHNQEDDNHLVVDAGESRYVISRQSAAKIRGRLCYQPS